MCSVCCVVCLSYEKNEATLFDGYTDFVLPTTSFKFEVQLCHYNLQSS